MSDDPTKPLGDDEAQTAREAFSQTAHIIRQLSEMRDMMTQTLDRLDRLETKSYDTKPIWERALFEILEVKRELREVVTRLDRMDARTLESRADVRELQDRVHVIERKAS